MGIKIAHFSPGRMLLVAIIAAIGIGTLLLALPISRTTHIPFVDLLFTATSVTTVTGALTIPLDQFTFFGHCVLLFLFQIGGIGFATISFFLMTIFLRMGLGTQLIAGQVLEIDSWKNIKKILIFIIFSTLCFEALGSYLVFNQIKDNYPFWESVFLAVFHAVGAFCNIGISLFKDGMVMYRTNKSFLLILSALITLGGLGFVTMYEIFSWVGKKIRGSKRVPPLSLHSKIVLGTTAMIIIVATIVFWTLEHNNTLMDLDFPTALVNSIFAATADRSGGIATFNVHSLQMATLFMIMILSFIGSSPGSTGSGIKTTVFAIYLATVRAAIMGRHHVELKNRRIQLEQVYRAMAIITLSLTWIAISTFFLLITESNWGFLDTFFEAVAAFTNLGLSTGMTPHLSLIGKWFIIASMVIGRIGSLTLILALRKQKETREFSYPEERVMLS